LDKDKQHHIEESLVFFDEPTDLYLLRTEEMDWKSFHETNGYGLWHRRMMHCQNQNLWESIPFTKGMEKLLKYSYSDNKKCSLGCMIGKSCHQDFLAPAKRATRPLKKVTFNLTISTITSVEGFNAAAPFVDDYSVTYCCTDARR
jgi:hypothetical protein